MKCSDPLLSAYVDGEANALQRRLVEHHLRRCANCAARHAGLLALRQRIREDVAPQRAPEALRARVQATLEAVRAAAPAPARNASPPGRLRWLGAGAVAGSLATALAWLCVGAVLDWRTGHDLADEAVVAHVHATRAERLVQVASSDQHTVKPWLSARLDYSPPVRDFAAAGFPLLGGRIDDLDGRQVATLVYRYRNHTIDVFVQPAGRVPVDAALHAVRGFNVAAASGSGMSWLAVSDVSPDVLEAFVRMLAAHAGEMASG